jgi:hypothetical protein
MPHIGAGILERGMAWGWWFSFKEKKKGQPLMAVQNIHCQTWKPALCNLRTTSGSYSTISAPWSSAQ